MFLAGALATWYDELGLYGLGGGNYLVSFILLSITCLLTELAWRTYSALLRLRRDNPSPFLLVADATLYEYFSSILGW